MNEYIRGKGVNFDRIRRLTGYLSTVSQANNAKRHEIEDRVKHLSYNKDKEV